MKCLIIKTSSLGDIIHTLPALTDAQEQYPEIQFDWVVEESFKEVPTWHPAVNNVIPVAIRRWRKNLFNPVTQKEWKQFKQRLLAKSYDHIIDAQGLLKSAWLSHYTQGKVHGYNRHSIREPLASFFYTNKHQISRSLHAVERIRQLFSQSLNYPLADSPANYGIKTQLKQNNQEASDSKSIIFFHGTTWQTKHWPEQYWLQLANLLCEQGYTILLPWGNPTEHQRAQWIKKQSEFIQENLIVLPQMGLTELAHKMLNIKAAISVDTGLAHLAAALDIPNISLFGPTNPDLTRPYGQQQHFLKSTINCQGCLKKSCNLTLEVNNNIITPACYTSITPQQVLNILSTS